MCLFDGVVQGCGIKGFIPTSVISGNLPLFKGRGGRLGEAHFVVSQKWSFPAALSWNDLYFAAISARRCFVSQIPIVLIGQQLPS